MNVVIIGSGLSAVIVAKTFLEYNYKVFLIDSENALDTNKKEYRQKKYFLPNIKKSPKFQNKEFIASLKKFKKKYKIKFDLLSDEKLTVIKKYGVWGKKSFLGKKFMGIVRTTFLINSKGKIHKIWSNVRVKDHAKEVLSELKKI